MSNLKYFSLVNKHTKVTRSTILAILRLNVSILLKLLLHIQFRSILKSLISYFARFHVRMACSLFEERIDRIREKNS